MFEKEAEEFERRKHYRYEDNDYCGDIADGIIQAYQKVQSSAITRLK